MGTTEFIVRVAINVVLGLSFCPAIVLCTVAFVMRRFGVPKNAVRAWMLRAADRLVRYRSADQTAMMKSPRVVGSADDPPEVRDRDGPRGG